MQHAVTAARGWRRAGLAFSAGALSDLAMAPFFLSPILFLTLPVLVWLIDAATRRAGRETRVLSAAAAGWWFAFGYFLFGLFWIGEAFLVEAEIFGWLLPFAVISMPAGLALFWAGAAGAAAMAWRSGLARVLVLALALGAAEWLRGHVLTGFPWNVLGYALTWPLTLMQGAGLAGIYGLTLIAVPLFAAPLVAIAERAGGGSRGWLYAALPVLLMTALPLAVLTGYGIARLKTAPDDVVEGVRLRIVQPSVPQRDKWRPDKQGEIFQSHLDLSRVDGKGQRDDLATITHVLWPEAAMPFLPLEHPEALEAIGALLPAGRHLLTGALRREAAGNGDAAGWRAFNSLMVLDDAGALAGIYDKTHLVPFGEYLPWQSVLEAIGLQQLTRLRGGFSIGVTPRPTLAVPGLPAVGGLICYEAIFPGVVAASAGRPGVLVNVTNDGWFGNTTGPRQHFHQARVRAVEEGVPLIRVANNGISGVIDASGRVTGAMGLNVRGSLDADLPATRAPPPYAAAGDLAALAIASLFAFFLWIASRWRVNRAG